MAIFVTGLGDADHPGGVLIGAGLHAQTAVVLAGFFCFRRLQRITAGRVVAQRHQFDTLKPHHPEGFRPSAVIADAHADDAAHGPPYRKAEVPGFEIAFFKMLEAAFRLKLGMSRQVNFAVFSLDFPVFID